MESNENAFQCSTMQSCDLQQMFVVLRLLTQEVVASVESQGDGYNLAIDSIRSRGRSFGVLRMIAHTRVNRTVLPDYALLGPMQHAHFRYFGLSLQAQQCTSEVCLQA